MAVARVFWTISGRQCPPSVVVALWTALGVDRSLLCLVRQLSGGRVMRSVRRDWLCLDVGARQHNHYHSSLRTREWVVAMPHAADDKSIYGELYGECGSVNSLLLALLA